MRARRRLPRPAVVLLAAVAALAALPAAQADAPPDRGTIVVTLEDGTTVTLRNWSLSYEYGVARTGESPLFAPTARREAADLYVGKKALPTAGQTLTITYGESTRSVDDGNETRTEKFKVAREVTLAGADGRKSTFKVEPPARDLLVPTPEKGTTIMARTLDARGETVTGTKKDFCLLSYTAVVECGGTPADRVVKIEFQR
jgi:hypothetical protein